MRHKVQTALVACVTAAAIAAAVTQASGPSAQSSARPNGAKVLNRIEKQLKTLNATTAAQWKRLNAEVASLHSDVGRDSSAGSRGQLGELRSALSGLQRSLDAIAGNTAFEDVN
jgi:uncharacterized protein YukE